MGELIKRMASSWHRHGPFGSARLVFYNASLFVRRHVSGPRGPTLDEFDAKHGTDTGGICEIGSLNIASPSAIHAVRYEPSNYSRVIAAIRSLAIDYKTFTFIDFGSGKGRVLFAAASFPFEEIVGVEFSRSLYKIAQENISKVRASEIRAHSIRNAQADAAQFELPNSNLVCYLYNPFGPPVLIKVIERLIEHHRKHSYQVIVIYFDPRHREVLINAGAFEVIEDTPQMLIVST